MISAIEKQVDGKVWRFRFNTRACRAWEKSTGKSIPKMKADDWGFDEIITFLEVSAENGHGTTADNINQFVDVIGLENASALAQDVFNASMGDGGAAEGVEGND